MKFTSLKPFFVALVFIGLVEINHGAGIIPATGYEDLNRDSGFSKEAILELVESSYFRKTLMPVYLERILAAVQNYPEHFLKGVENANCTGNVWRLLELWSTYTIPEMGELHTWALHMVDAWAKPPEGLLSGHINAMGDYDECVGLKAVNTENRNGTAKDFTGRYCTVYVIPKPATAGTNGIDNGTISGKAVSPNELLALMSILEGIFMLPTIGVCFPDTCEQSDIKQILVNVFEFFKIPAHIAYPTIDMCYVEKKPDFDAADISVISLLGVLGFTCLFTGLIDMYTTRGLDKPPKRSLGMQYLMAFSFYTNIRKWQAVGGGGGDDLGCVHGIRFLSTCWVILAHTWYMVTFIPVWNMVDLKTVHESWPIMLILNSTVSVDTFFLLSGMLVCYAVMKTLEKQKGSLNIPMFYVHRYLRLTPTYAFLVAMMATIFPYLGSGPFWKIMDRWSNICENNWWTNMLYVNNFVNTSFLCQGEAWYLANDFQFYIFSPIVIFPLYKWASVGIGLLILVTTASVLCPGLLVYYFETTPTTIGTREIQKWFLDVYIKPWPRAQTYLVGIALGYMLYKTKGKKVKIPVYVQIIGWIVSTGTSLSVLFGMYPYFDPLTEIPRIESFFYAALNRFGWSIAVGWVIFVCVKGYGGIINTFLSWKAFIPLGRLCFCAFLVSLHLQMVLHLSFRQAITFEPYSMVNFFFAHLVMSFLAAFVCTITMESPFIILSKLLLEGGGRRAGPRPVENGVAKPGPIERHGIFYQHGDTAINTDGGRSDKNE